MLRLVPGRVIVSLPPAEAWLNFLQTRLPVIPTSALVECCDELSRARCGNFSLWKSLGNELSCRVAMRIPTAGGAHVLAAPTALDTVVILRSFAGANCRHRKLLLALESHRGAFLDSLQCLRSSDLQRLIVACGQLQAASEFAEVALGALAARDEAGWSPLTLVQTVHATVRLSILPAPRERFWRIWARCRDNALKSGILGRNEVTTFAAAVALQKWNCARTLAGLGVPGRLWPECSLDVSMWIGSMAVLLGVSGAPPKLWRVGMELFTEACAVYCGGAGGCLLPTSEARQMLTFALVTMNLFPDEDIVGQFAIGPGLSELLAIFQDDGSSRRRSKSRLQEEVLQTLLIVLHTDANPLGGWKVRPHAVLEEPCLAYDLDIYVAPWT